MTTKVHPPPPDPPDYKKALKKLADEIQAYAESSPLGFCENACPAIDICEDDHNSDDHRCRRVLLKWARRNF